MAIPDNPLSNVSYKSYKDNWVMENEWKEVAEEKGEAVNECTRNCKSLRDVVDKKVSYVK